MWSGSGASIGQSIDAFKKRRETRKAIKAYRARRAIRLDEEPASWVTINGNHIPLDEDKNPIGGQLKAIGGKETPKQLR